MILFFDIINLVVFLIILFYHTSVNDHPVREQRHRLSADQTDYNKKLSSVEYRLQ